MKVGKTREILARFANALEASETNPGETALQRFVSALAAVDAMTAQKLVSSIDKTGLARSAVAEPTLGAMEWALDGLAAVLKEAGAKKQIVADVDLLLDFIRRHRDASIAEFEASAVRLMASASRRPADRQATPADSKQLVEGYLQRLQAALGDDGSFRVLYGELGADRRVTKSDMIEIASRFVAPMPPSTTRPKALLKVLYRHQKLVDARAASASIGGKAQLA